MALRRRGAARVFAAAGRACEPHRRARLPPGPPQPKVSPAEAGIDPAGIERSRATTPGARNTRALVIGHGGHIVFEKYWDDTTFDTPVDVPGFAPALAALVLGHRDERSADQDLDAPLSNYIAGVARIRPRGATSAARAAGAGQCIAGCPMAIAPTGWHWCWSGSRNQPYQTLVARRGCGNRSKAGDLAFDSGRAAHCGAKAARRGLLHPRAPRRLDARGELLANDGVFEGNQFTPPRFIEQMLRPAHKDAKRGFFTRVDGSFRRARCGVARGRGQTTVVDRAVAAADDPARGRRAASGSQAGMRR